MKTICLLVVLTIFNLNIYSRPSCGGGGGGSHSSFSSSSSGRSSYLSGASRTYTSSRSYSSVRSYSNRSSNVTKTSVGTRITKIGNRSYSYPIYRTPLGREVRYSAYRPIYVIYPYQYHYYHYGYNWVWYYIIFNYHTQKQDTIKANNKYELDEKVKETSGGNW